MSTFQYKILQDNGRISRGRATLPFDDIAPAIRYLERQGGVVLSIKPLDKFSMLFTRMGRHLRKVKRKELAEVLHNISVLLSAGVPVLTAITDVQQEIRNPTLQQVLRFLKVEIENGQTLSQAMSRHPGVFSQLVVSMCSIGEETGRLDQMLLKSTQHLLHIDEIMGATKRALLYPAVLTLAVLGVTVFWFMVVVPQLVQLFHEMDVELPLLTRSLIAISDFFQVFFLPLFLAALSVLAVLSLLRNRSRGVRLFLDTLLLRLPVIRTIVETSLVARVSEYLGILVAAGIDVMRALDIVIGSLNNRVFEQRFIAVREALRNGRGLSDSMRQANAMHPFAIRMVAVGEETGKIDEQTLYVAKVYRERLGGLVEMLGKSLEPVMLVFLGCIFALVIGGLLLPIYDLIQKIQ
jgi:type IV pilus assembly protein PilC